MKETDPLERETLIKELFKNTRFRLEKRNMKPGVQLLGVESEEVVDNRIQKALKGEKNWVLIGGPPCQAYSLVGRSRRQWKENLDKKDVRVHLYKEYLRIIATHSPAVFVMENVKGLLSSKVDGVKIFDLIKRDLRDPSIVFEDAKYKYKIFS